MCRSGSRRICLMVLMTPILKNCSPVLVYHAAYRNVPRDIREKLHNVHPEIIHGQLSYLKKKYRIVSVDELTSQINASGAAAVTFDDGYKCVIDEMYDILLDLDIPFTIFINSASMEDRIFWRDKVRYVISNNLVNECESFFQYTKAVNDLSFYKYTKHPENNSRLVDDELDNFLKHKKISLEINNYCFDDIRYFKSHKLVFYGNHTHNHYVLSSLSTAEQVDEICRTRAFLQSIAKIQVSEVFSIPFGQPGDFNDDTLTILRDLGYRGVLLSRQRLNCGRQKDRGLTMVERFMPKEGNLPLLLTGLQIMC
jgi:peptidoglycan/xylan/chitin deacetylase (PgdA/CDA1 family)